MSDAVLEHVNITVTNPDKTASMLCQLFDWHIRWQCDAKDGGGPSTVCGADAPAAYDQFAS